MQLVQKLQSAISQHTVEEEQEGKRGGG